jgi:hypothetical protein
VKRWETLYEANEKQEQAEEAIVMSEQVDFNSKLLRRDKEGHYVLVKEITHQEVQQFINIYTPNTNAPDFIKHTLLKGQIGPDTIIVGDLCSLFSSIDHPYEKSTNFRAKVHYKANGLNNRYLQNIPSNSCGICILLKAPMELSPKSITF